MSLIFSNYPPLNTDSETYHGVFTDLLERADSIHIASGYISSDAVIDLKRIVEANGGPHIELNIGMHYFDGLSKQQAEAVRDLDALLRSMNLGGVYFVVTFPFHGKVICFRSSGNVIGGLVGSSNLTNIVDSKISRQYEVDYSLPESDFMELDRFITKLNRTTARAYKDIDVKIVEGKNSLLDEQYGVSKAEVKVVNSIKANPEFEYEFHIPLKTNDATKSNLNTFNGKGRENKQGFIMPRSWYEVELIVPASILRQEGFPLKGIRGESIEVITDDGWTFRCESNGQNGKNFRSHGDLKILGKWIKGRLEHAGALKTGELCSQETLDRYGRDNLTLAKIKGSDVWFLDFGVNSE
ncbi:NgoFVII family restriction endonuclease [bacterium]|nr:NgoFVII family restriction endonuclease [bacterium]